MELMSPTPNTDDETLPMRTFAILLTTLLAASPVLAQTSFPMITHTYPVTVQRGKTTELTVEGQQNFFGTYKALFEGTGISAEVMSLAPPKAMVGQKPVVKNVKLKL